MMPGERRSPPSTCGQTVGVTVDVALSSASHFSWSPECHPAPYCMSRRKSDVQNAWGIVCLDVRWAGSKR